MKQLAVYCRISVDRPNQKSIEVQKELGGEFAKKKGWAPKYYVDQGISGGGDSSKRPAYTQMVQDIEDGQIQGVFVYDQDRLMREEMVWFEFMDTMLQHNIEYYENGILTDLADEGARMLTGFKSIIAASYRRSTSKRIKASIQHNLKEGKVTGILAYGYKSEEKTNMMVVNEEEAEVVRLIFNLSLAGDGIRAIANELQRRGIPTRYNKLDGVVNSKNRYTGEVTVIKKDEVQWNPSSIFAILRNENYIGKRVYGGVTYECPAIVDEKIWRKVHARISSTKTGKKSSFKYLLNDIIHCGECGGRVTGRSVRDKIAIYRCTKKRKKECTNRDIKSEPIERAIWEMLFAGGKLLETIKNDLKNNSPQTELLEAHAKVEEIKEGIKAQDKMEARIVDLVLDGTITKDQTKGRMEKVERDRADLQARLVKAEETLDFVKVKRDNSASALDDLERVRDEMPFEKRREIIHKYISRIVYKHQSGVYFIEVIFNLEVNKTVIAIDTKYNLALDSLTGLTVLLSDEYINTYRQRKEGDLILKRLFEGLWNVDIKGMTLFTKDL